MSEQHEENNCTKLGGGKYCSVVFTFLTSLSIFSFYIASFWYAPDEGVFAHMADRLNDGQIYGVDFKGLHPGYHTFFNAFLLQFIERDLLVLRLPLFFMGLAQAVLVTYMFRRYGFVWACLAGFWATVFGFLQYQNPAPNWYCTYFAFFTIFVLAQYPRGATRLILAGLLVGISLGFRHPSGIFLGAGVLCYVVIETALMYRAQSLRDGILGRVVIFGIISALTFYCFFLNHDIVGFFYIGLWPILFAVIAFWKFAPRNKELFQSLVLLSIGGLIAIAPLILYQLIYGDVVTWFQTSILNSTKLFDRDSYHVHKYWNYPVQAFEFAFANSSAVSAWIGGFYWLALYLLVPFGSMLCVYKLWTLKEGESVHPLLVLPLFNTYVSLFLQIPIYLMYSLVLMTLSILYHVKGATERVVLGALCLGLCVFSLMAYVGNSLEDHSNTRAWTDNIDGVTLQVSSKSVEKYEALMAFIDENSSKDDPIFTFPANPEIYYLSGRHNPTPYIIMQGVLNTDADYEALLDMLKEAKPPIVMTREGDQYFSHYEAQLLDDLQSKLSYELAPSIGDFTILLLKD